MPQLLAIVNHAWPSEALAFLLGQSLVVQGVIARAMANETVNRWLSVVSLGAAPCAPLTA